MKNKLFKDFLTNIKYPSKKESWDIAGVMIGKNGFYRFDTKSLRKTKEGQIGKYGSFSTEADKIVYDIKKQFIVVDTEELHQYLKNNKVKIVQLDELISALEWNIILPK